jgi:hypothetical protein
MSRVYYDRLVDVKIINSPQRSFDDLGRKIVTKHFEQWVAVYHKVNDKYIVTDDINKSGLNGNADIISVIGYADSIDLIMFVIYEHQVSLGKKFTIFNEIKLMKKDEITKSNDFEWEWNQKKMALKNKYMKQYDTYDYEYYESKDDPY